MLFTKYEDVFFRDENDFGCFFGLEFNINIGKSSLVKMKMRRIFLGFEEEEKVYLDNLLKIGVIRFFISEWVVVSVLIRKFDGKVRYCLDYRGLN